jgi:hypothetical protein
MLADARQVFRNCELYNPPGSDIRFLAQGLEVRGGPAQGPEPCRRPAAPLSVSAPNRSWPGLTVVLHCECVKMSRSTLCCDVSGQGAERALADRELLAAASQCEPKICLQ